MSSKFLTIFALLVIAPLVSAGDRDGSVDKYKKRCLDELKAVDVGECAKEAFEWKGRDVPVDAVSCGAVKWERILCEKIFAACDVFGACSFGNNWMEKRSRPKMCADSTDAGVARTPLVFIGIVSLMAALSLLKLMKKTRTRFWKPPVSAM